MRFATLLTMMVLSAISAWASNSIEACHMNCSDQCLWATGGPNFKDCDESCRKSCNQTIKDTIKNNIGKY